MMVIKKPAGAWLVLFQLALCPPASDATEYFVDALHGNDTVHNGLTMESAKATIQAGLELAVTPGDVVSILPGEYLQGFILSSAQSGVTVRALGEVRVSSTQASAILAASGVRVEGLTFTSPIASQLVIAGSSDVVVKRCRFYDGSVGLILGSVGTNGNSQVLIRECLFAGLSSHGLFSQGAQSGVVAERCTFGRNGQAVGNSVAGAAILVRNSAIFENAAASTASTSFAYCSFFGEASAPGGTNRVADPLFIDPDRRVYLVRSGSPLLDQGQDGGPIGAFGQGFHTSADYSNDEPPGEGSAAWSGWIDSNGSALAASSLVELTEHSAGMQEVILRPGRTSAAIYSPVFNTGSPFSVIRSVDFAAFEDTDPPAGEREVVDQDPGTPRREVRIRVGQSSFAQDPDAGPEFQVIDRQVPFKERGQYVQLELTLRRDGN